MQVEVFTDPRKFLVRARPVIDTEPARCNVIATLAAHAASTRSRGDERYLLLHHEGRPAGVAKFSPVHGLVLGPLGAEPADGASALLETLTGQSLPSVIGPSDGSYAVAAAWAERTGRQWVLQREDVLYVIDSAPALPEVTGSVREPAPADRPWLDRWFTDFHAAVHPHPPGAVGGSQRGPNSAGSNGRKSPRPGADRTMLLWLDPDGLPVSMAGVTPAQAGMSRIGPVFTPSAFRGHGYASALTAAGTALAFERGARRVMLYADKANPTSNRIYQRLGYRRLGDAVLLGFAQDRAQPSSPRS